MQKRKITFLLLSLVTVLMLLTCKPLVSLGATVDVLPPNGEITYPDAGETPIRGSFVLKGAANDDDGVQSISIVFENIETKQRSRVYEAEGFEKGSPSVSWTINVDNESTGTEAAPHELVKIYPIPDGEYTAILSVTDKGGKTSTFTKNYKIDNTPPVFIVSRPSTIISESAAPSATDQADGYGAIFSVIGQAGERNTVERLNVLVNGITLEPVMFVGNNINAQVAVYTPTNALYGLQAQDNTKPIKGALYLYDNAREYKGGDASGEGNKAGWYYLRDSVYTDVIAKGYTPEVISDYFAGKKGSDRNDHDKKILELRGDAAALNKLKTAMVKMEEKRSTFKLDPKKSPGFKVIGVKHLAGNDVNQASAMLFKPGNDTTFSVELIPNKDKVPLVNGSNLEAYKESKIKIVLLKWNGTGFDNDNPITLIDFETLSNTDMIKMEGGNLRVQCTFPSAQGEGIYEVKVNGTDTSKLDSNKFEAYDDSNTANGMYVIKFFAAGTGPRVRPVRPQRFKNANFKIEADVTGIDASGHVWCKLNGEVPTSPDSSTVELVKLPASEDPSGLRYAAQLDISSLTDGDYEIHFLVKASSGSTDTDKTEFSIDKTAPVAGVGFPLPTDPQAGKITISGTINDGAGSGVKEAGTKWILGKKASVPALDDPAWQNMTTSTKGSWNIADVDLDTMSTHPENYGTQVDTSSYYKVPLYIRSEDMLGNATVHTREILFNSDGTKPVVRVLSPQADAIVGGTIQIFGTASAVTGGPSAVGKVYVQFSKTNDFTNQANMIFGTSGGGYDSNWYQGGTGQIVPGTGSGPGQSGAEWQLEINGNGAFNGTSQRQDVYFRLRAKNKNNNRLGEWTTPIKIIVDKDAPLITDVKIEDTSNPPQNYETNMWIGSGKILTAKLTDPSGIKEVKITSDKMSGGISYTQATAPVGWLTPYSEGDVSGYTLSIPLNISGMSGNDFSIKVEIKENTTTGLSSDSTFTFRFDTTPPTGFFGSDLYINSGYFGDSSVTNAALADKLRDLGANTSSGAGCKILADNTELTVTGVSGSTVSFIPSTTAKEYNYILYKPETLIYNEGSSSPWIVRGVANDDGSGVAKVEAWVTVDNGSTAHTIITETDNTNKITRQLGGQVTWKGQINLSSLKDGKGTLHYKITDKSGNEYTGQAVDVRVKNKQLKVTTIKLSTDIGGSAVEFANDNVNKALKDIDIDSNLDFTANYTSSAFAFKNKDNSKIKVDFTGGEGQVKYTLKYNNAILAGHNMQNISNGGIITLSEANLNAIGNTTETAKELVLKLWDSSHGCTPTGTAPLEKSSFAEVKINTLFEAIDTKPPTVVILPFHWNKEDDNSLYQNNRTNGHVEIDTSSVSGKVTIRGFAYDNIKLDKIEATFQDASLLNVTATRTGNTWASNKTMAANDVELKVTHLGADYLGYYVKWELSFDSSKIPMGAAKDIKVTANDGGRNSVESDAPISMTFETVTRAAENSASHASFISANIGQFVLFETGQKRYLTRISSKNGNTITLADSVPTEMKEAAVYKYTDNKTKTAVKSVPYITGVSRKSTYNTKRARSGAIPLLRGEEGNTLTGFNFTTAGSTSLKITANKDGTGSSVTMENLSLSGSSFTFKVPDTAKDGYLHLVVNGVAAVNNINAYTESNMEKSDTYGTAKHSDDRLVHIWRVNKEDTFKGSKNAIYPAMSKANDGTLYASFSNYSKSQVYYSNAFTGSDAVTAGDGATRVFTGYDPPEETDITVDETEVNVLYAANYHGGRDFDWGNGDPAFPWNDTQSASAGGLYLYDKDAPLVEVSTVPNYFRIYRFELFTYDNELQQFKNIRTVRSGDNIYTVYYDRLTGAVKFAWVDDSKTPDTSTKALPWCVIDGNTDITDRECKVPDHQDNTPGANPPDNIFTFVNPDGSTNEAKPYILNDFEDGLSVSNAVWESIAVTATTQGYPVVVYMDAATGSLRLARSTEKQPKAPADWKIQKVLASSDPNGNLASDYINACIGTDGYLHIAFQNTKGQLVYVKSTNRSDTGSTKYTFGTSEVLDDSGMSIDMTMNGATPYISYVSRPNSYDAIRIAYRTSMDFNNTGTDVEGWETMTAPLNQRAANSRICIETQAKHYVLSGTASNLPVAVGFTTGSDYRVAFYVGK